MKHSIKIPRHFIRNFIAIVVTVLICLLAYFFVHNLSKYVPTYSTDDVRFAFLYKGGDPWKLPRITNLGQYVYSVIFQFMFWNARLSAIAFETWFSVALKQETWAILNSLVYVLVGVSVNILVFGKKVLLRPQYLVFTFLLLWFVIPNFGMDALWHAGTANYLWVAPLYLIFLIPYVFNTRPRFPALRFAFIVLMGILAGTANEIASSQTLIVIFLLSFFDNKDFESDWKWIGFITVALADFFSIFRDVTAGGEMSGAYGTKSFMVGTLIQQTVQSSGLIILACSFLIVILILNRKKMVDPMLPFKIHRCLFVGVVFFIAAFAGVGALIISPLIEARIFFSNNIFFLLSFLNLFMGYVELRKNHPLTKLYPLLISFVLVLIAVPSYETYFKNVRIGDNIIYTSNQIFAAARKAGKQEAAATGMPAESLGLNTPFGAGYLIWYTNSGVNAPMSIWQERYYGVKKITLGYTGPIMANPLRPDTPVVVIEAFYDTYVAPTMNKLRESWYGAQVGGQVVYAAQKEVKDTKKTQENAVKQPETTTGICTTTVYLYNDRTGKLVGSQKITAKADTVYDISQIQLPGYKQDLGNMRTYKFSNVKNQILPLWVHPNSQKYTLTFTAGATTINSFNLSGLTGESINAQKQLPYGYEAVKAKDLTQEIPAQNFSGNITIVVKQKPFWQRLPEFWPLYLIVIAFAVFIGLDQVIVRLGKKKIEN